MDFLKMFQQAVKIKEEIKNMQDNLANQIVQSVTPDGKMKIVMNGKQQVMSVTIAPEVLTENDVQKLQDLVLNAVNQAIKSSQEATAQEMNKITAGLGPLGSLLKGL